MNISQLRSGGEVEKSKKEDDAPLLLRNGLPRSLIYIFLNLLNLLSSISDISEKYCSLVSNFFLLSSRGGWRKMFGDGI